MKGLLIEFDLETGKRAGGIDPHDPNLQCYGWQNLGVRPALEIRVIEDDRDVSQYEGIKGVKVLRSDAEIDAAIDEHVPRLISVSDEALFRADIEGRGIKLKDIPGTDQEALETLKGQGVKGIRVRAPPHVADIYR